MVSGYGLMTWFIMAQALLSGTAHAESLNATLHGRIVSVPCYINNKSALDFDFNKIGIKRVDGIRYAVSQDVPIKCDKDVAAKIFLKVRSADTSSTAKNVLNTNVSNLGIALYDELKNADLQLNTEIEMDKTQVFRIKAVPVMIDINKPLEAKTFTVTATVVAYYE